MNKKIALLILLGITCAITEWALFLAGNTWFFLPMFVGLGVAFKIMVELDKM